VKFPFIVLKSLRQHILSTCLAILSIALGAALFISVFSLREQTHLNFTRIGLGVDAVLGPKGSPLQIVLNSIYHLDEMPGKIKWTYYKKVLEDPVVESGIPFCTGHSYAGFRVNAIAPEFFTDFEYKPGEKFSFLPENGGKGRLFSSRNEAVVGAAVARELKIKTGDSFNPVCGVKSGDPVHVNDRIVFVGIMAPTGTPHDRAIYIPLNTFYTLEGHGNEVRKMAVDEKYREISGAYIKIKRIRGGALNPGIQDLKYNINQSKEAQLVVPTEVLPGLFHIIGWVDGVLLVISILVSIMALLFLFISLTQTLRERKRDIAIFRSLGASRRIIFGLIICESIIISIAGGIIGLAAGHGITAIGSHFIKVETGLRFSWMYISSADYILIPAMIIAGVAAGLIPAIMAYRTGVVENLTPVS
jgi:putative ABC transport system permease protein